MWDTGRGHTVTRCHSPVMGDAGERHTAYCHIPVIDWGGIHNGMPSHSGYMLGSYT